MDTKQPTKTASKTDLPQNIIIENRQKISVSGVEDIESFNEQQIVLYTNCGVLVIDGHNMHISKLSIENGETFITGDIDSVVYHDSYGKKNKQSLLSKLLR